MFFVYSMLGGFVGTLVANFSIVAFGVWIKNKKGGVSNVKKN